LEALDMFSIAFATNEACMPTRCCALGKITFEKNNSALAKVDSGGLSTTKNFSIYHEEERHSMFLSIHEIAQIPHILLSGRHPVVV
jgi:hypothetical protein